MISFASLQKEFLTKPPTFTRTIFTDNCSSADRLMDFQKEQGDIPDNYILELQGEIDIGGVSVYLVHNKIMKEGDPTSLFKLIVHGTFANPSVPS